MNSPYTKQELIETPFAHFPIQYTSDIWQMWECFKYSEKLWSNLMHYMMYSVLDGDRRSMNSCISSIENVRHEIQELKEMLDAMNKFGEEAQRKIRVLIAEEREEARQARLELEREEKLMEGGE